MQNNMPQVSQLVSVETRVWYKQPDSRAYILNP